MRPVDLMIERKNIDGVELVILDHGKVNALDLELLVALSATIREVEQDDTVRAVVLTSDGRAFSAGVDLQRIEDGGEEYTRPFLAALSDALLAWYGSRLPVVTALNGAAIAGGCILATTGDVRLIAQNAGKIGAIELSVGVGLPVAALEILRHACGASTAGVVLGAAVHGPADAVRLGLCDEVVEDDGLRERAMAVAERLANVPEETFRLTKRSLRGPILAAVAAQKELDEAITSSWCSLAVGARISAQLAALKKPRTA